MENVRANVFETNSSSSHSVSVTIESEGVLDTIAPDKRGEILIHGDDWSYAEFSSSDSLEKAGAIAIMFHLTEDEDLKKMFEKVVLEHTGATKIVYDIRTHGEKLNSYMSSEVMCELERATKNKTQLKNFIFNKYSEITGEIGYDG